MIAENRINTVFGAKAAQKRNKLVKLLGRHVLQIARKHYHVGLLSVDTVDNTLKHLLVLSAVSAEMGIAKLHYAIAVEGLRQVGRIKVFMAYVELPEAYGAAIDHDIYLTYGQQQSDKVAPVVLCVMIAAMSPAEQRAYGKNKLGDGQHTEKKQINVEQLDALGRKVARERKYQRIDKENDTRSPPQQALPPQIPGLTAQQSSVDVDVRQDYHQHQKHEYPCNHFFRRLIFN